MKAKQRTIVTVVAIFSLIFSVMAPYAALAAEPAAAAVSTDPNPQLTPAVSGDIVVWKESRNGNFDIYGYDLAKQQELAIVTDTSTQQSPAVSGNIVVWQDLRNGNWDIFSKNLVTGVETQVTTDLSTQQNPAISGNIVVWEDFRDGDWEIYSKNLTTGVETRLTTDPGRQRYAEIDGNRVVWEDNRSGDWDIYMMDLGTSVTTQITSDPNPQNLPDISGSRIVWQDYRNGHWDIYSYNVASGTELRVTNDFDHQTGARISGQTVIWQDFRGGNFDMYMYDVASGAETQVTSDVASQLYGDIDGTVIVWEDLRNGNQDIFLARLEAQIQRVAGSDRYDTASAISVLGFGATADTVVIATGAGYADALSASALAGAYDAPLLLTRPDALPTTARNRILDLGATSAVVVGGEKAVSGDVVAELEAMGLAVDRVFGVNRYDTARRVAERVAGLTGVAFGKAAFLVRGDGFADALAVSPYAFSQKMPVLLTPSETLAPEAAAAISATGIDTLVVAGGERAVSTEAFSGLGLSSTRVNGTTRYATAVAMALYAETNGWATFSFVGITTGSNYPDALAGGVTAGNNGGVLLMTPADQLDEGVRAELEARRSGISEVQVFGGEKAVGSATLQSIVDIW